MATSGTIGSTVIATDVVISHAMRRCGVPAVAQTPEIVEIAQECLFLLLLSLASRGVNLWCIDKQIMEAIVGQKTYILPIGTLAILNAQYSTATYVTGTPSSTATAYQILLSTTSPVQRVAVTLSVLPTAPMLLQFSDDGITWITAASVPQVGLPALNTRTWFDMNITGNHTYYRVYAGGSPLTVTEFLLCSKISDLPMTAMNRDDYTSLPDKNAPGSPAVNYFFEKLVNQQATLWPVPNVAGNQFWIMRHRQVQDVGTLAQTLELPSRWFEEIIWQLAMRLCFELPAGTVDPVRMQAVMGMADKMLIEVEHDETDGAPTFYVAGIGCYTK